MRSLFLRIFLSFWTATVVIGALLVVLALTTDPRRAAFRPHEGLLEGLGHELAEVYRSGGSKALRELEQRRAVDGRPHALLFRGAEGPLSGVAASRPARRLAARAAATGERQSARGPQGLWLALPMEDGYVLVAQVPPPSRLHRLLDPYGLTLRLGLAFLVIVVVSYLVARSLSDPIRELRRATQRLADGELGTRVGPTLRRRRDESAELGRDFDRMAERIEGLLEAQRRLLRDVSHELRSPLARLHVALGLARGKAGAEAGPSLDQIEREAERLNDLIGQLLTLTRLESGTEPMERVSVSLDDLLQEVARDADFEGRATRKRVRVEPHEPVAVDGAPELLRRALDNVLRNAVRFTPEGTEVEVRLDQDEGVSGPVVRISVRDRGPGVPEEALSNLSKPFYRVADARDRASGGTGLGLAIAAQAARWHGGTLRASNAEGGGLEVVIELPARHGSGSSAGVHPPVRPGEPRPT